jgi:HlyD family secretion protein/epimerase transport system membrane fusion protein
MIERALGGPPVDRHIRSGLAICTFGLGSFTLWAALAPLTSAAMAPGIVKASSHVKTVQHFDGGIVSEILVRDGDHVTENQLLLRLQGTEFAADHDALDQRMIDLETQEARLVAQRDHAATITLPKRIAARSADPKVVAALAGQQRIFADQAATLAKQTDVWRSRIEQYRRQIAATEQQNETLSRQIALMSVELKDAASLLAKGYERKSRVLEIERREAGLKGDLAGNVGRIAALEEQIGEAELQIEGLMSTHAKDVSEELRNVQSKRAEVEEALRKAASRVARSEIRAPQDGTILNMRAFAPGQVVSPGGALLDIVPSKDELVIEARVQPLDIDVVHRGLRASVRFVAFKQRTTPTLDGEVTRVSADAFNDERSGQSFFTATVRVDQSELKRLPQLKLYSGMPTEVAIITGNRTLLDYLIQPFTDSFAHALNEE